MRIPAWLLLVTFAQSAAAEGPAAEVRSAAPAPARVEISHVPLSYAEHRRADLALLVRIRNGFLAREVRVRYRPVGASAYATALVQKGTAGEYLALIPAAIVAAPGFEYYVESVLKDGSTVLHFASPARPHRVIVHDRSPEQRRAERLARYGGHRYDVSVAYRYMNAGTKDLPISPSGETRNYRDSYNQLEANFVHRILSEYIHQISFSFVALGAKLGMSRPFAERAADPSVDPSYQDGTPRTGVYFGRGGATWELAGGLVGFDLSVILGANQTGFAVGGGATLRFGRLSGTHLDIGFEGIQSTGYDVRFEFAWDTVPRIMMSLRADLTNYPSQDGLAVFPSFNIRWAMTRDTYLTAFVGYGTRFQYQHGGVSAGAGFGYQF